jgi:AcrR family transcriptional regulator
VTTPADAVREGGLRERKRLAAMRRIQEVAIDLFEARGFDAVTVEEIADASDVSPSSVYRYFGTKEELVFWDDLEVRTDDLLAAAFAEPVPLDGVRRLVLTTLDSFDAHDEELAQRRVALMMSTPELEQAGSARTYALAEGVGRLLAARLGRPAVDLQVQVFAHALTGGLLGMFHHWHGTGFARPLREVAVAVFEIFAEGLDIVTAPAESPQPAPAPAPAS